MTRARYAVVVDAGQDQRDQVMHRATAAALEPLIDVPGLLFLGSAGAPHRRIANGGGIIWGHVFSTGPVPDELPEELTPHGLLADYWGGYVALFQRTATLLRDPSAAMGCYHLPLGSGRLVASDAATIASLTVPPSVDIESIGQMLLYRETRTERTALTGIEELLPGMQLAPGGPPQPAWLPATFLGRGAHTFEEAAKRVRDTSLTCIGGWSEPFDHILLELSGGLDSSIVAAGLTQSRAHWTALTFAAGASDLDEAAYAGAVTAHLGADLISAQPGPEMVDLTMSRARHVARPNARSFNQAGDDLSIGVAREVSADAFFAGTGGDSVYAYMTSVLPALDRLRADGVRGFIETVNDLATLCEVSPLEVVGKAIRRALSGRPIQLWFVAPQLLHRDAIAALPQPPDHPWLATARSAPLGKQAHIVGLLRIHNYLEGHKRFDHAPMISPLLSQPLLELCLSVPTWVWCKGGRNRAPARTGFSGLLPDSILKRRSKGSFDGFSASIAERNRSLLREMLLEGIIASNNLLDRPAIDALLTNTAPLTALEANRLLLLADAEAWAMAWQKR